MTDRELTKKLSQEDWETVHNHLRETDSLVGCNSWDETWDLPWWKRAVNWVSVRVLRRELFQTGAKTFDNEVLQKMLDDDHIFTFGYGDMPNKGSHARMWDGENF